MTPDQTPESLTLTAPTETAHDAPVATAPDKPTRSWRGAPTRQTADGGTERYCRVCRLWHPVAAFRPYVASGCANTLCRTCERTARRLRYLRDQELERTRAQNWSRNQRAKATLTPVATGEEVIDEADSASPGALACP